MMDDQKIKNACLDMVFHACYRLRLNMEVTAMALSVTQRYMANEVNFSSSDEEEVKLVVATCLFLASKTEESPRRLRDVINVAHRLTWSKRKIIPESTVDI
jgi:hypothetical protein